MTLSPTTLSMYDIKATQLSIRIVVILVSVVLLSIRQFVIMLGFASFIVMLSVSLLCVVVLWPVLQTYYDRK